MFRNKPGYLLMRGHRLAPVRVIIFSILFILSNTVLFNGYSAYDSKLTRSMEYIDTDLRYIFRDLAVIGQFSVVLDQNVTGDLSISFAQGVSLKDAVAIVAKTSGYWCKWVPDTATFVISNNKDIRIDETRTLNSFLLKSAWAVSVAQALEVVIPRERIRPDIRNNRIEVMANNLEQQNITEIITRLETEERIIHTEVKFYAASYEILKQIVTNYNPNIPKMGIYRLTDKQREAFPENTALNLLAKQDLATIDSREENVFIGDRIPRVNENNEDGKIKYSIAYTDIGTLLNLKSRLENDHQLTVRVNEKVFTFNNSLNIGLKGPKVDSREIESTVRLAPEESFLLLGPLQYNEYLQMKNSPFKLSILNELFGQTEQESAGTFIVITPRLTGNVSSVNEELNVTPEVTPISKPVDSPIDSIAPTTTPSPSASDQSMKVPVDEEKQAIVIQPDQTSSEADNSLLYNLFFSDIRYILKKGDSLEKITRKFGTTVQIVIQRNRLDGVGEISIGSSLIIPVSNERIYIIKPKETLWRIAKRYGTTVEILKDLNSITDNTLIRTYQKIVLPGLARRIINPKF